MSVEQDTRNSVLIKSVTLYLQSLQTPFPNARVSLIRTATQERCAWWDNIDDTSRYKRWHPTAHRSFQWQVPPSQPDQLAYSVGAVQWVVEDIGPYRSSLLITWLDPAEAADQVEYEHWIYVKTDLKVLAGILPQRLIHEYQWNDADDGIVMRSSFTVPRFFDVIMPGFSDRLAEHALQEMQFLPNFLPELFEREYVRKDSCAQCTP